MSNIPRFIMMIALLFLGCFISKGTYGAAVIQDITYTYNNSGMITGIVDSNNSYNWSYQYDDVYRLTGARRGDGTTLGGGTQIYGKAYAYNNIGNITGYDGQAYTYADAAHKHAVTTAGTSSYAYDANGNMLTGADRVYSWSADNKPVSVTKSGVETAFVYGSSGERVKKETGDNFKIYVGGIYEKDQTGAQTCYIDADGVSVKKKANGSLFFILKDHLSGTAVITDAQGTVVTQQYYEPFGEDDAAGSVENEADDHKFTGQEEDRETGLYYYGARYYDPALGRFISPDPLFGLNKYMYCSNNPTGRVDPTGYIDSSLEANNNRYQWLRNGFSWATGGRVDEVKVYSESGAVEKNYDSLQSTADNLAVLGSSAGESLWWLSEGVYTGMNEEGGDMPIPSPGPQHPYLSAYVGTVNDINNMSGMKKLEVVGYFYPWTNVALTARDFSKHSQEGDHFSMGLDLLGVLPVGVVGKKASSLPNKIELTMVDRRISFEEMRKLTARDGVEYAQSYYPGPGKNGGGGTYALIKGELDSARIPINAYLVGHTHRLDYCASGKDYNALWTLNAKLGQEASWLITPNTAERFSIYYPDYIGHSYSLDSYNSAIYNFEGFPDWWSNL